MEREGEFEAHSSLSILKSVAGRGLEARRHACDFPPPRRGRLRVDQEIRPAIGYGLVLSAWRTRRFMWLTTPQS